MVKFRDAKYCNLKLFLIFLVVYGHLLEPQLDTSAAAAIQYRAIYLVHMPLFAFLTGLFAQSAKTCGSQCKRLFILYAGAQAFALAVGGTTQPLTPYWHLWYLLSSVFWFAAAWVWFRFAKGKGRFGILAAAILLGCAVGWIPWADRAWSFSRTVAFFPYFWAGILCDSRYDWKKLRTKAAAACAVVICVVIFLGNQLPLTFLYHAEAYPHPLYDTPLRLLCYLLGGTLCVAFLAFTPMRRLSLTPIGADTLPIYLLHAPIVSFLRRLPLAWPVWIVVSAILVCGIYAATQLRRGRPQIVPIELQNPRWPLFKQFSKRPQIH